MCMSAGFVMSFNNVMRCGGLLKLIEELNELGVIAAKYSIKFPDSKYYDGTNLTERLQEEMGDVLATLEYVTEKLSLSEEIIKARADRKFKMYHSWEDANREMARRIEKSSAHPFPIPQRERE